MSRRTTDPMALRSPLLFALFGWYLRRRVRRAFHAVRLSGPLPVLPRDRPVIVFSNHPSWWDPAIYIVLAGRLFPDRPGFGPMEATALARYRFFRRLGIFGIDKGSAAGARRFLQVCQQVLGGAGGAGGAAMLWVTAEGDFTDVRVRPVRLRPGIAHLASLVPNALLLPLAFDYVFWNESRPELLARFGAPIEADRSVRPAQWRERLEGALTVEMDALAAEAIGRSPRRFTTLLRGRAGAAPTYDLYRRARSLLAGQRFTAAHEEEA